MATTLYQQVALEKKTDKGFLIDKIWIPQKFAIKDSYLECKRDGVWSNGWKVYEVYAGTRTEEDVVVSRDLHKHHRKGTDI